MVCSVKRALRKQGVKEARIKKLRDKALAGTYKACLRMLRRWVNLKRVKTVVRVAAVVHGPGGEPTHYVASWRDPRTGVKRGQAFRVTAERIQTMWPKHWVVVFVDPEA